MVEKKLRPSISKHQNEDRYGESQGMIRKSEILSKVGSRMFARRSRAFSKHASISRFKRLSMGLKSEIPTSGMELLEWTRNNMSFTSTTDLSFSDVDSTVEELELQLSLPVLKKVAVEKEKKKVKKKTEVTFAQKLYPKKKKSKKPKENVVDVIDNTNIIRAMEDEIMTRFRKRMEDNEMQDKTVTMKNDIISSENSEPKSRKRKSIKSKKPKTVPKKKKKLSAKQIKIIEEKKAEEEKAAEAEREEMLQKLGLKRAQDEENEKTGTERNVLFRQKIQKIDREYLGRVLENEKREEWLHYSTCSKVPKVDKFNQLTYFVHKWELELDKMTIEDVADTTGTNLELLNKLDEVKHQTPVNELEKLDKLNWAISTLREVQWTVQEKIVYRVLSDIYDNMTIDNLDFATFQYKSDHFTLSLWLKLDWPISLPNPKKPPPPKLRIILTEVDIDITLPDSLNGRNMALMCFHLPYDHKSDSCNTYFAPPMPDFVTIEHIPEIMETCCAKCTEKQKAEAKKMTQFLIDNKPELLKKLLDKYDPDRKYKEKCADKIKEGGIDTNLRETNKFDRIIKNKYEFESHLRTQYMNKLVEFQSKNGNDKYPIQFVLPEVPLNDSIPKVPVQHLSPNADEYVDLADELYYDQSFWNYTTNVDQDELNLREFHIVGGIFNINIVYHPPQCQDLVLLHMTIRRVSNSKKLKYVPFQADFPSNLLKWHRNSEWIYARNATRLFSKGRRFSRRSSRRASTPKMDATDAVEQQILKEIQENWEAEMEIKKENLVLISLGLPRDVVYLEQPTVCMWDENLKTWDTGNIRDVVYETKKRRVNFRTTQFGIFGLAVRKHANFPYIYWDIRPMSDDSISITLAGAKVSVHLKISQFNIEITRFENMSTDYNVNTLDWMLSKVMTLPRLIKIMRFAGLDLFPEHDANCYYKNTSEKHWAMSYTTYHSMAMMAAIYNFSSSKWNSKLGRRSIVLKIREFDPSEDTNLLQPYHMIHVTPSRCEPLRCTEEDDFFFATPPESTKPNLFYLLKSMVGATNRARLKQFSPITVHTLAQFLVHTRLFSFS